MFIWVPGDTAHHCINPNKLEASMNNSCRTCITWVMPERCSVSRLLSAATEPRKSPGRISTGVLKSSFNPNTSATSSVSMKS